MRKLFSYHRTIWLIISNILPVMANFNLSHQISTSRWQVLPDIDLRQTRFSHRLVYTVIGYGCYSTWIKMKVYCFCNVISFILKHARLFSLNAHRCKSQILNYTIFDGMNFVMCLVVQKVNCWLKAVRCILSIGPFYASWNFRGNYGEKISQKQKRQ